MKSLEQASSSKGSSSASLLRSIPTLVWIIAVAAVVARSGIAFASQFTNEDFYITLRYAENIAHGHGFVYNVGERVLGTTTPLYTLFLALCAWVGASPVVIGKAVNILADGALCVVVYLWLRELKLDTAGKIAAFFIAVNPIHIRWSVSGMETSLVTLLGAWIWLQYFRRSYVHAYIALGVLFLLRWDSMLLGGVLTAAVVLRERRVPVRQLALYVVIVLPWMLFAYAYFGYVIPVTGAAKMTVYGWRYRAEFLPVWPKLFYRFAGTPGYFALTLLSLAGLWLSIKQRLSALGPAIAWFLFYWITFLFSKVLLFEWYIPPTWPVYEVLSSIGFAYASQRLLSKTPYQIARFVTYTSASSVYVCSVWMMYSVLNEAQAYETNLRQPLGLWLKSNSKPNDRILLEPIGYIGYYSERPILDAIGLVSPTVLRHYVPQNAAPWLEIVKAELPEWCVLRPGELQHILDGSRATGYQWESTYERIRTVSYSPRAGRESETFIIFRMRKRLP